MCGDCVEVGECVCEVDEYLDGVGLDCGCDVVFFCVYDYCNVEYEYEDLFDSFLGML